MCARQVDEAAAKLKMEITSKPQHLDEIDRKILQLEMERLSLAKVGSHAQHPLKLTLGMPLLCMSVDSLCWTDGGCACVQAATADKTAKQRLSQLDAQLNELKKEQAELTKQWEREKVCPSCLHRYP